MAADLSVLYVKCENDRGVDRFTGRLDRGATVSNRHDGIALCNELIDAEVHVALSAEECVEVGLDLRASPLRAGIGNDAWAGGNEFGIVRGIVEDPLDITATKRIE